MAASGPGFSRLLRVPTPDFVLRLRERVGHDLLFMSGVTGVVLDGSRVLLGRRTDTGRWAIPSGILEPGEEPASAVLREVYEETCVVAEVEGLAAVTMLPPTSYPNGDQAEYLDLCFRCRYLSGTAVVGDDESQEVGWFEVGKLPETMSERSRAKLDRVLAFDGRTYFTPPS